MSSSVPVPSKAAIHALRGLLFGTSCSLVLLAEERRQRIKFARSAVENGRKLKSVRRYNTSGSAVLEERLQDALRDPDFIGWSHRSEEHGSQNFERRYLDHRASSDLGPDPRYPRRSLKRQNLNSSSSESLSLNLEPRVRRTPAGSELADHSRRNIVRPRFRSNALDEPLPLRKIVPLGPSTPSQGKARTILNKSAGRSSIALVWDWFLSRDHHAPGHESALRALGGDFTAFLQTPQQPGAALDLFRRAYSTIGDAVKCPEWLLQLSVSLSTACYNEGDCETAGRILEMIMSRMRITETNYLDHRPYAIIDALISQDDLQAMDGRKAVERLDLAAKLYLPKLVDDSLSQLDERAAVGEKLINSALSANHLRFLNQIFEETRCTDPVAATTGFIEQLQKHKKHKYAIDIFLRFYVPLPGPAASDEAVYDSIVNSVLETKGYGASKVLGSLKTSRGNRTLQVPGLWVKKLLWCHWTSFVNHGDTEKLYREVEANGFYGIQPSYQIRATMVGISAVAGESSLAQSEYEMLCALYPSARKDVELLGAFALAKAKKGDWAGVRTDFVAMMHLGNEGQQAQYSSAFGLVLKEFSKSHTWGEIEDFLEQYIQDVGVRLDHFLARFVADRHGRCRDIKALRRWLKFCATAGFAADEGFWIGMFKNCLATWSYSNEEVLQLCHALSWNLGSNFKAVEKEVQSLIGTTKIKAQKLRRAKITLRQVNVADEQSVYKRMMAEALHKNWKHVYGVYIRATHNGMGFSRRCLRLAVQASVSVGGASSKQAGHLLRKAQSEGHDTSVASVPLILAELAEIHEAGKAEAAVSGDTRGHPYPAIRRLLLRLEANHVKIDDSVFNRAARTCLLLRNYREAIALCVSAAEANGNNDLCYSDYNFSNLLYAHTSRHDYDRVGWLMDQLQHKEYRSGKLCRTALKWAMHYLKVASEVNKAEKYRASDLATLKLITDVHDRIRQEMRDWKKETRETLLGILTEPVEVGLVSLEPPIELLQPDENPGTTSQDAWQRLETVRARSGQDDIAAPSDDVSGATKQDRWQNLAAIEVK